mmetsp:Transcript_104071/g.143991  ORF Transcript_104071/g.143991 Transcript_104071/m.143991 type:complete len:82 (+) Transcript_104071:1-246(+)
MCNLPRDKTLYCLLTSEQVTECCSQMRVLPDRDQDPTDAGCCHPPTLRIQHKWCDMRDCTGRIRTAIGELSEDGVRYQDIA